MNIIQQQESLKNLSDQQIAQEMQHPSGQTPLFLISTEAKRRADLRERFKSESAGPPPTSTVQEDLLRSIMAQQMPQTGITQGLGPQQQMALEQQPQMAQPQMAQPQMAQPQMAQPQPQMPPEASGIMQGAPQDLPGNTQGFADGGMVRGFAGGGPTYTNGLRTEGLLNSTRETLQDWKAAREAMLAARKAQYPSNVLGAKVQNALREPIAGVPLSDADRNGAFIPATPATPTTPMVGEDDLSFTNSELDAGRGAPPIAPTPTPTPNQTGIMAGLTKTPTIVAQKALDPNAMYAKSLADLQAQQPDRFADLNKKYADREAQFAEDKDQNMWLALARGGFGAAAGTSPYALSNIAAGGIQGMDAMASGLGAIRGREDANMAAQTDIVRAQQAANDALMGRSDARVNQALTMDQQQRELAQQASEGALNRAAQLEGANIAANAEPASIKEARAAIADPKLGEKIFELGTGVKLGQQQIVAVKDAMNKTIAAWSGTMGTPKMPETDEEWKAFAEIYGSQLNAVPRLSAEDIKSMTVANIAKLKASLGGGAGGGGPNKLTPGANGVLTYNP